MRAPAWFGVAGESLIHIDIPAVGDRLLRLRVRALERDLGFGRDDMASGVAEHFFALARVVGLNLHANGGDFGLTHRWSLQTARLELSRSEWLGRIRSGGVFRSVEIEFEILSEVAADDLCQPGTIDRFSRASLAERIAVFHSPAIALDVSGSIVRISKGPGPGCHFDAWTFGGLRQRHSEE